MRISTYFGLLIAIGSSAACLRAAEFVGSDFGRVPDVKTALDVPADPGDVVEPGVTSDPGTLDPGLAPDAAHDAASDAGFDPGAPDAGSNPGTAQDTLPSDPGASDLPPIDPGTLDVPKKDASPIGGPGPGVVVFAGVSRGGAFVVQAIGPAGHAGTVSTGKSFRLQSLVP